MPTFFESLGLPDAVVTELQRRCAFGAPSFPEANAALLALQDEKANFRLVEPGYYLQAPVKMAHLSLETWTRNTAHPFRFLMNVVNSYSPTGLSHQES